MIRFEDITTEEYFNSVSFEIKEGILCKIITDSDYEKKTLIDVIFSMEKPVSGRVFLFGKDIYSVSEKESVKILTKIGIVPKDGGLISNLKVWENITLPIWYHTGKRPRDVEDRVIAIFGEMGKDTSLAKFMGRLSGALPTHEKRLAGMVRAMLMEPDLIIYDSIFEGLNPETVSKLQGLTTKFHLEKPGRTSVYISSEEQSLKDIKADIVLKQHGKGLTASQ